MKFLSNYKLYEKTTLLSLGVPFIVMKQIQRDYSIKNAEWEHIRYKKDLIKKLKNDNNILILSISKKQINIIFSYENEFYFESYIEFLSDDFGVSEWQKENRIKSNFKEISNMIFTRGFKSYKLKSGTWEHEFSNIRKMKQSNDNFDNTTIKFKNDFIKNYSKILNKINIIYDFSNNIKPNSLNNLDEYLIKFEDEYSTKYKEYLNLPMMIDRWSREKIMTAFMIFIQSGKLIKL